MSRQTVNIISLFFDRLSILRLLRCILRILSSITENCHFLNQRKGQNDRRSDFIINPYKCFVAEQVFERLATPGLQCGALTTELGSPDVIKYTQEHLRGLCISTHSDQDLWYSPYGISFNFIKCMEEHELST